MAGQETLQELFERRQRQLGAGGGPISVREVWLRGGGDEHWSYEIVRKIAVKGHTRIGDDIAERLSIALQVPVDQIWRAAGQRNRGRPLDLGPESAQLSQAEREIMRMVMKGLLGRYKDQEELEHQPRRLQSVAAQIPEPPAGVAARRGRSRGKEQDHARNGDGESPPPSPGRGE